MSSYQVKSFVKNLNLKGKTLEVGSQDINGNVRDFFKDYVGLDLFEGKNVDIRGNAHNLPFKSATFQNVLSLESIEHDDQFWKSIPEMIRVLKPGGKFVLTAPGYFMASHHGSLDFWRFSKNAVAGLLKNLKDLTVEEKPNGVFLVVKHEAVWENGKVIDIKTVWGMAELPSEFPRYIDEGFQILPIYGIFAVGTKRRER